MGIQYVSSIFGIKSQNYGKLEDILESKTTENFDIFETSNFRKFLTLPKISDILNVPRWEEILDFRNFGIGHGKPFRFPKIFLRLPILLYPDENQPKQNTSRS